jgi:hypothetical protein
MRFRLWDDSTVDDAIARYRAASEANAIDARDGLIRRIRPHLRPWLATTLFALLLGPKVVRHPGVVLRACRG